MEKYKLVNTEDGNIEVVLDANNIDDAIKEAFEILGYKIVVNVQ